MYRIIKIEHNYCGQSSTPQLMKGKYKSEVDCVESIGDIVTDYIADAYIEPLHNGAYSAYYIVKD